MTAQKGVIDRSDFEDNKNYEIFKEHDREKNNKTTQMFYLEPYLTKSNMYKKIYIHDYLCEIYNFSFTAETVFLSFFLGPFVFLFFT